MLSKESLKTSVQVGWYNWSKGHNNIYIVSFTETSEAEAFHDPVSVTQTRRSESAGYNHCRLPESGDG